MHTFIGIDADVSRGCGIGIPIIQADSPWCWWHSEQKTQKWFAGNQLKPEVLKHGLHLLREPVPFTPKKAVTALFAATDFLDFNRVILPVKMDQQYCQWGCIKSTQPLVLITYTSPACASQWLDDLARMTVHSIDRQLRHPAGTSTEQDTRRAMADMAIRIARDPSISLNLHVRICTSMLTNEEINPYFCEHVTEAHPNIDPWKFEQMMYAYIQNLHAIQHFFHS